MSDFFEPLPEPPRERHVHHQPPWMGPPPGTLPGVLALELVLAQTDEVVIAVSHVDAYPTGFGFDVHLIADPNRDPPEFLESMMFGPPRLHAQRRNPDQSFRLGLQLADGTRLTDSERFPPPHAEPPGPSMRGGGGGGGGGRWRHSWWVWPPPPAGPLEFVCQWPAAGIPLTRQEIDAETILEASRRARVVFEDEGGDELPSGTWTSYP